MPVRPLHHRGPGCPVEDLFWLEADTADLEATPAHNAPLDQARRWTVAQVGGRWVAHPIVGRDALRLEMVSAKGEGNYDAGTSTLAIKLLDNLDHLRHAVVMAGCTPALSLWARAAERWHPDLRVHWTFDNSMNALHRLLRGELQLAGMHLYDPITQTHNVPAIATGQVTAGVSTASVAAAFGLGVIPLHSARYDLVTLKPYLDEAPVQQLLNTLGHHRVLSQLAALGGYDTHQIDDLLATLEPTAVPDES